MILTQLHIMADNISLNRIGTSDDYDLISLYENYGNTGENDDNDSPFLTHRKMTCILHRDC